MAAIKNYHIYQCSGKEDEDESQGTLSGKDFVWVEVAALADRETRGYWISAPALIVSHQYGKSASAMTWIKCFKTAYLCFSRLPACPCGCHQSDLSIEQI